ncbi:MAG: tRNA uridine-5-carboxymethylaminomethyl(34) synthesis GTPase MnmE, partial [Vicinamibacterales bacterium]
MFSTTDTIVAVATPRGRGAIGMVRLSGEASTAVLARLTGRTRPFTPRVATLCRIDGLDEVVVTFFEGPASFTGEDVVEVSAHGSPVILDALVAAAIEHGARHAQPGEFTLRAVLNGRMDLVQAEAVADLIQSGTRLQAATAFDQLDGTLTARIRAIEQRLFELQALLEASLDFPDEGYRFIETAAVSERIEILRADVDRLLGDGRAGRVIREGARVVLAGSRNAGKSTLFNRLVGFNRAIVSDIAGTTRDMVTEEVDLDGLLIRLVDTAGLGAPADAVEAEGMARARGASEAADLTVVVRDGTRALTEDERRLVASLDPSHVVVAVNKIDLVAPGETVRDAGGLARLETVSISARDGAGLAALQAAMLGKLRGGETSRERPAVSNARHIALLA